MPLQSLTSVLPTIEIDGMPQPSFTAALVSASIEHGLDQPARATLVLALPPPLDSEAATAIVETARISSDLRLTLPSPALPLFQGTIVQVAHDLAADHPPRLEVTAVDALAALDYANATVVYPALTPVEIVRAVAARNGLQVTSEVDDGPERPQTVQAGETDLAFLQRLALALDAGILADGSQLRLVRRTSTAAGEQRLVLGENLHRLRVTADATALPRLLGVRGWSPDTQEAVGATRTTPKLPRLPAFDAAPATIGAVHLDDPALSDQPAVTARSAAAHALGLRRLVTATGLVSGQLSLRPGATATLDGVGSHAAGDYTIMQLSRTFDTAQGWQTAFTASRQWPDPSRREPPHADRRPGTPARPAPARRPDPRLLPERPLPPRRPGR